MFYMGRTKTEKQIAIGPWSISKTLAGVAEYVQHSCLALTQVCTPATEGFLWGISSGVVLL